MNNIVKKLAIGAAICGVYSVGKFVGRIETIVFDKDYYDVFLEKKLQPKFKKWLEETFFGEPKEYIDANINREETTNNV